MQKVTSKLGWPALAANTAHIVCVWSGGGLSKAFMHVCWCVRKAAYQHCAPQQHPQEGIASIGPDLQVALKVARVLQPA